MRRLGQHFLKNQNVLRRIARAVNNDDGTTIIEVGPGHGELTKYLRGRTIAVEKDPSLAKSLSYELSNIEILEGDILKTLPKLSKKIKKYKLTGNIPYYLTGYLFRIVSELENKPSKIVFTIQKEVAERICAAPPKMNLLAASIQFWAEPQIIETVSKRDFNPPPQVDSAVIVLDVKPSGQNQDQYMKFVKVIFKQPRKTILNNLANGLDLKKEIVVGKLKAQSINPQDRPQNLNLSQLITLSNVFSA